MFYFTKNPRIAYSRSSNHDTIYSITLFIFFCFLRTINISVAKDGNMNTWIVFHLRNQLPVGLALIHLRTGSSMNAECFYAYILQSLRYFFYVFRMIIPAEACLHCYGEVGSLYTSSCKAHHQINVFEDGSTGTFT